MKNIFTAIYLTLKSKKHLALIVISALVMALVAISLPVFLTPGNTFSYNLSLLSLFDIILIFIFSLLFGLSIGMQSYARFLEKQNKKGMIIRSSGSSLFALVGSLFSAKLCPICLGTLLGVIGIGGSAALFLFSYKNEIIIVSLSLLLVSIYLASKQISFSCDKCVSK